MIHRLVIVGSYTIVLLLLTCSHIRSHPFIARAYNQSSLGNSFFFVTIYGSVFFVCICVLRTFITIDTDIFFPIILLHKKACNIGGFFSGVLFYVLLLTVDTWTRILGIFSAL